MAKMTKQDLSQFIKENPNNPAVALIKQQLQKDQEDIKHSVCIEPVSSDIVSPKDLGGFPDFSETINRDDEFGSFVIDDEFGSFVIK